MACPSCGAPVHGLRCAACGTTRPRDCPGCASAYTSADRHCRQCGRDLFFLNFERAADVRLRFPLRVLPEAYEYPADRQGLKLLKNTGPLRELTRVFIREVSEPLLHGQLLGNAVKVTEKQFAKIRRQASVCERILDLAPVNIFVGQGPQRVAPLSAFTYGTEESACIFLSSGLVDALDATELRFAIGHEMGHIKSRHVLYLTIANMLSLGLSAFPTSMVSQVLASMLGHLISPWQRKAEITADRAGLLCAQDVHASIRTMVKVSLGGQSLFDQLDLDEYLKQADTLKSKYRWSDAQDSHPYLVHRINLLREFSTSSAFRQIMQSAYDPACPKILCVRCQAYEYVTDRARPLARLACGSCSAPLSIAGIYCPHCHAFVSLADAETSLDTFACPDCRRGYFDGLGTADPGPPESHYQVLGIPGSASEQDVERAYVRVVKPTLRSEVDRTGVRPSFDDIRRRIRAHAAYRVLGHRKSREEYDMRLELLRELHRDAVRLALAAPPERLPGCSACGLPVYGPYCTQCGLDQRPAAPAASSGSSDATGTAAPATPTAPASPAAPARG
jgi:Zn-dependent protease with chaperone function